MSDDARSKAIDEIASRIRGYASLRYDIMELADEENRLRLKLIEVQGKKNEGITRLVEYADSIFSKALPEYNADGTLRKGYEYEKSPTSGAPMVEVIAEATHPNQRHCSNCGEAGHTARTCTNERKVEIDNGSPGRDVSKPEKKKRKMKPLSEEAKKAKAEILKKAREAKAKKRGEK